MKQSLKLIFLMTLLTGFIYPMIITFLGQSAMPFLANGSLITSDAQFLGSLLIAKKTEGNGDFWPRPSSIDYDPLKPSGGSNLGPTSQELKKIIKERKQKVGHNAPPELLFASGSGLDPHISLETAYYQIPRIAKNRGMKEEDLKKLIDTLKEGKQFHCLGPEYVNVLLLNKSLDDRRIR